MQLAVYTQPRSQCPAKDFGFILKAIRNHERMLSWRVTVPNWHLNGEFWNNMKNAE